MFTSLFVLAQDVAPAADAPVWMQGLMAALSVIITAFLLPWLKSRAAAAKEEAAMNRANAATGQLNAKQMILSMVKDYLFNAASVIVEAEFPRIAKAITNGELKDVAAIKVTLLDLGRQLKSQAVSHFDAQGIDLIAAVGDDYLDELIRYVADKVSPFPGKDTATAFLTETVSDMIVDKGVNFVRAKVEGEHDAARTNGHGTGG